MNNFTVWYEGNSFNRRFVADAPKEAAEQCAKWHDGFHARSIANGLPMAMTVCNELTGQQLRMVVSWEDGNYIARYVENDG